MRRVLSLIEDGVTGSPSEVDLIELMRSAPIPIPACQFEVQFPEGDHAFPDFAWPDRGKCIEVDGFDAHGTPEALERDLIRQNRLLDLGWELRRFSARRIRRDPVGVIDEIVRFVQA
jgi:very-short-patch-repair endonuclease